MQDIVFTCGICYLEIDYLQSFLIECPECKSDFHESCIEMASKSSKLCPICKIPLIDELLEDSNTMNVEGENENHEYTEFECLRCNFKGTMCCVPRKVETYTNCSLCRNKTFTMIKTSDKMN